MIDSHNISVREDIGALPIDIMQKYMDVYSENDNEFPHTYVGEVVDNNDPEKLGRCRIRVFGIFDSIPEDHIPWAIPEFSFIGSNKGSFIVPTNKTIVSVYFHMGEIHLPRYTTKVVNTRQFPKNKNIDYPDNMIFFETDNGDSFELNRKKRTAKYTHSSGTKLFIKADGSVEVDSVANTTIDHKRLLTVTGSTVIPTGVGPLCSKPICPYDGTPHTGTVCNPGLSFDGDIDRGVL